VARIGQHAEVRSCGRRPKVALIPGAGSLLSVSAVLGLVAAAPDAVER
jgi:hypothetical protein